MDRPTTVEHRGGLAALPARDRQAMFQGHPVTAASRWNGTRASQITVPERRVCAGSREATPEARGGDNGTFLASDLSIPQAWEMAVPQGPAGFQGIKYTRRLVGQPCLALFNREGLKSRLEVKPLGDWEALDEAADWLHDRGAALG